MDNIVNHDITTTNNNNRNNKSRPPPALPGAPAGARACSPSPRTPLLFFINSETKCYEFLCCFFRFDSASLP